MDSARPPEQTPPLFVGQRLLEALEDLDIGEIPLSEPGARHHRQPLSQRAKGLRTIGDDDNGLLDRRPRHVGWPHEQLRRVYLPRARDAEDGRRGLRGRRRVGLVRDSRVTGGGGGGGGGGFLIAGVTGWGPLTPFPDPDAAEWTRLGLSSDATLDYGPDWEIVSADPASYLGLRYLGEGGAFRLEAALSFADSNFRSLTGAAPPSVFVWTGRAADAPTGTSAPAAQGRCPMLAQLPSGTDPLLGAYYLPAPPAVNVVELATNDEIEIWARASLGGFALNPRLYEAEGFRFFWSATFLGAAP